MIMTMMVTVTMINIVVNDYYDGDDAGIGVRSTVGNVTRSGSSTSLYSPGAFFPFGKRSAAPKNKKYLHAVTNLSLHTRTCIFPIFIDVLFCTFFSIDLMGWNRLSSV